MSAPRSFTAAVYQEQHRYTAHCLEIDISSQGNSVDEAVHRLRGAVARHLQVLANPEDELSRRTPAVTSFDALTFTTFQVPGIG